MDRIKALFRLPAAKKHMLAEAILLFGWYRLQVKCRAFPKLIKCLGVPGLETITEDQDKRMAADVSWAVLAVCKRTPWKSTCLVQAMTARRMLVKRGLSCTLYMGAMRNPQGQAVAHAWLRCGKLFVTGGNGSGEYAVTGIYGTIE